MTSELLLFLLLNHNKWIFNDNILCLYVGGSISANTSSTATSGSSTLSVKSGTTVYGFAVLDSDVKTDAVSRWTLISDTACKSGAIYRVGSKKIAAETTYNINLFSSSQDFTSFLFLRSGSSVGSWTINNHTMQASTTATKIYMSGDSIYCEYDDYDGSAGNTLLGSFSCPAGYTVSYSVYDSNDTYVSLNSWTNFNGPYTIIARTGEETTTT